MCHDSQTWQTIESLSHLKIAVIPARGGSKRIPRKNIRYFAGKPIVAYSIEAARQSHLFDRIIVSTDDHEIAKIANDWGAETPFFRPEELANDYATTSAVVKHAIRWHAEKDISVKYVCCIYATAPFIQPIYLHTGLESLLNSEKLFALSVTSFSSPIQRAVRLSSEGALEPFYPEYIDTRSQDLVAAYHDAGQFCWGRADAFLNDACIFSSASLPIVLPRHLVQDMDTLEDWQRAELMYQAWKQVSYLNERVLSS